jgi:hypothetical protein
MLALKAMSRASPAGLALGILGVGLAAGVLANTASASRRGTRPCGTPGMDEAAGIVSTSRA